MKFIISFTFLNIQDRMVLAASKLKEERDVSLNYSCPWNFFFFFARAVIQLSLEREGCLIVLLLFFVARDAVAGSSCPIQPIVAELMHQSAKQVPS